MLKRYRSICAASIVSAFVVGCGSSDSKPPSVVVNQPTEIVEFSEVTLDASQSVSQENEQNELTFHWSIVGDGKTFSLSEYDKSTTSIFVGDALGDSNLTVNLVVTDENGKSAQSSYEYTVVDTLAKGYTILPALSDADVKIANNEGDILWQGASDQNGQFIFPPGELNGEGDYIVTVNNGYLLEEAELGTENTASYSVVSSLTELASSSVTVSILPYAVERSIAGIEHSITLEEASVIMDNHAASLMAISVNGSEGYFNLLHYKPSVGGRELSDFAPSIQSLYEPTYLDEVEYTSFFSAYGSAAPDQATELLQEHFVNYFDFNNRDQSAIESSYLELTIMGNGTLTDANANIAIDSQSPDFKTIDRYVVDSSVDVINLVAEPSVGYEFASWEGCPTILPSGACQIAKGSESSIKVYFIQDHLTLSRDYVDITGVDAVVKGDLIYIQIDATDSIASELNEALSEIKIGDLITGPVVDGGIFATLVDIIESDEDSGKYVFSFKDETFADFVESGTMYFNKLITNADIATSTGQSTYQANKAIVLSQDGWAIKLNEDPNETELEFIKVTQQFCENNKCEWAPSVPITMELEALGATADIKGSSKFKVGVTGYLDNDNFTVNSANLTLTQTSDIELTATLEILEASSSGFKDKLEKDLYELPLPRIYLYPPFIFLDSKVGVYLKGSATITAAGFAEASMSQQMSASVSYTRMGGADGSFNLTSGLSKSPKIGMSGEASLSSTIEARASFTVDKAEIPIAPFTNIGVGLSAKVQDYTGNASECSGVLHVALTRTEKSGAKTTWEDGIQIGFWTIPIDGKDVQFLTKNLSYTIAEVGVDLASQELSRECIEPAYAYSASSVSQVIGIEDTGNIIISQEDSGTTFTVKNESLATGTYKLKIGDPSAAFTLKMQEFDSEGNFIRSYTPLENTNYSIDGEREHRFVATFNSQLFRSNEDHGQATLTVEVIPIKLADFGAGAKTKGQTFKATADVTPITVLSAPGNLRLNSDATLNPSLSWDFDKDEVYLYRYAGFEFEVYVNGELYDKVSGNRRSLRLSLPEYDDYTFSVRAVVRTAAGELAVINKSIVSKYTKTYEGTFSYNCGAWDVPNWRDNVIIISDDENGVVYEIIDPDFPMTYIRKGSSNASLTLDVKKGYFDVSLYIEGQGSVTERRWGSPTTSDFHIGFDEFDFKVSDFDPYYAQSYFQGSSWNGPECSRESGYASSFKVQ